MDTFINDNKKNLKEVDLETPIHNIWLEHDVRHPNKTEFAANQSSKPIKANVLETISEAN